MAMTMNEDALTKYFDLPPGKWRINSSVPGFKVVAVALVDLRRRLFPLRQVELSEFARGVALYLLPVPLHAWRLKVDYAPREETRARNALGELTGAN